MVRKAAHVFNILSPEVKHMRNQDAVETLKTTHLRTNPIVKLWQEGSCTYHPLCACSSVYLKNEG